MDCMECSQHVQQALAAVPGVESVEVLLSSEKAVLRLDPTQVPMEALHQAVEAAGYDVAHLLTDSRSGDVFLLPISLARSLRSLACSWGRSSSLSWVENGWGSSSG